MLKNYKMDEKKNLIQKFLNDFDSYIQKFSDQKKLSLKPDNIIIDGIHHSDHVQKAIKTLDELSKNIKKEQESINNYITDKILLPVKLFSYKDKIKFMEYILNKAKDNQEKISTFENILNDINKYKKIIFEEKDDYKFYEYLFLELNYFKGLLVYKLDSLNIELKNCNINIIKNIDSFYKLFLIQTNSEVIEKMSNLLYQIYNYNYEPKPAKNQLEELIEKAMQCIKIKKNYACMKLMEFIFEQKEKPYLTLNKSHSHLCKKSLVKIQIINEDENKDKKEGKNNDEYFYFYENTTILEILNFINKKIGNNKYEFYNGDNIIEEKDYNQSLYNLAKEKKSIKIKKKEIKKEALIQNEKLANKLENILKNIFNIYCNEDKIMKPEHIHDLLEKAIYPEEIKPKDLRIYKMLKDAGNNNYLTEELFLSYNYKQIKDKKKEECAWKNLNNFGYAQNLEKVQSIEILDNIKNMRYYLSNKINDEKLFINEIREENPESNDINLLNFILSLATNVETYNNMLNNDFSKPENKFTSKPKNYIDNMYDFIIIESILEDLELNEMKKDEKYKDKIYFSFKEENKNIEQKEKFFENFIQNGYVDLIEYMPLLLKNLSEKDINNNEIMPYICSKGLELINEIYCSCFEITIEKKRPENFSTIKSLKHPLFQKKLGENIKDWEKYKNLIEPILLLINKYYLNNENPSENVADNLITNCFYLLFNLTYLSTQTFEYIINNEQIKNAFDQALKSFLLYNKNILSQLGLFNNKLKKDLASFKIVTYIIDIFFSLLKSNDSDTIEKVISNLNMLLIYSLIKYDKDESSNKFKAHLNDIIQNTYNLIKQMNNDSLNEQEIIILTNYLKFLKKIISLNRPDLKELISTYKIKDEESFYLFILEILLHNEKEQLTINKNKFLKFKDIMSIKESKFIPYDELIDNLKKEENKENKEKNFDKYNGIMKELNELYFLCFNSIKGKNNDKLKGIINKFKLLEKIEQENIQIFNSLTNKENNSKTLRKKYGKNVGLTNLGTTCYINSIMQLLFMIPAFRFSILSLDDKKEKIRGEYSDDDNILHQMQKLFTYLLFTADSFVTPQDFFVSLKDSNNKVFSPNNQKDSYEFYSYIYEKLELILKEIPNNQFLIQNFFMGKACNISECETCKNTSKRYEDFTNLSLKVENVKNLEDSLNLYISKEKIEDYNCDKCKRKVNIGRYTMISKLPNYLVIHLQRIIKDFQNDKEIKLNNRFEFPLKLNMKKYFFKNPDKNNIQNLDNDYEYNLIGINVHIGNAEGGHFISVIKDQKDDRWYEFDDKIIRDFDINNLEDVCFGGEGKYKTANLLIYEKVKKEPIIQVLDENDVKVKQNAIEKNLEENNDIYELNNIYLDKKGKFLYQFKPWDLCNIKNIPKEYFLDIFNNSKIYFKLLANNCIHNLDNFCIKILLAIFNDKQFNINDYDYDVFDDLLNILLNTIISYYYRDNNNEENKELKIKNEEDIIFILQKIITPIILKAQKEKNNLLKILEKVSNILFSKENLVIIFSKDSVLNDKLTKEMYILLNGIIQLNNRENNKKLFKDLNQIINDTKETKEISFYVYQIIFDFFKNNIIDRVNIEEAKNIFMPLYYKLYKEKNEENLKNITDILNYLITDVNILAKEEILELKQVLNIELYKILFNVNLEFLIILTQKLQYDDLQFSNAFNTSYILKLYSYCEKNQTKENKLKYKLMKFILGLLEIIDKYTLNRFELLLGYPSLVFTKDNKFGVSLMENKIETEIYEYISYNHIKKEQCLLANLFPSKHSENKDLNLDEQDRLDLIYELISTSLGLKENKQGNYFLFKYLYLMQSRSIFYESLYQEIKILLNEANNKKYDLALIKNREVKCIEIVNYEKENLEHIIVLSSGVLSTVDTKKKKYKMRPELPEIFGKCKEFIDENFNIDYYGLGVNIVPYEVYKIFISLIASNDSLSIFRFEYFTNYFTRKELLTFHDEGKEFTFDFINHEKNEDEGEERGDFEEMSYREYLKKRLNFNEFLREMDEILKEKEGINITNNTIEEDSAKKSMIRYFVLSKKKSNVLKLTYKMYEVSKDIEKNFYLPDTVFDSVEKGKDKNVVNIHRIKHNFKFLEKNHIGISLSNLNYEKYMNEYFN